jgi:hypothetical protein
MKHDPSRIDRGAVAAGVLAAVALLATGCAVPQDVLEDAKASSRLMQEMQAQMDEMTRIQASAAQRRLDTLRELQTLQAQQQARFDLNTDIMAAAGMASRAKLAAAIESMAAAQVESEAKLKAQLSAMDARSSTLLGSVPSTHAAVAKVVADLAPLRQQRSKEDQVRFVQNYVKAVRTDIKQASEAASPAAAAASAANP